MAKFAEALPITPSKQGLSFRVLVNNENTDRALDDHGSTYPEGCQEDVLCV